MYCYLYEGIWWSNPKLQYKLMMMNRFHFSVFFFADREKLCASCSVSIEQLFIQALNYLCMY